METIDATRFFTRSERDLIEGAVREAEKRTSGEIVPVLATRSGTYGRGHYQAAILAAVLGSLATIGVFSLPGLWDVAPWNVPASVLLPVQALCIWMGFALSLRWPAFQRAILPQSLLEERVWSAARRAFGDLELTRTVGSTGIMIYVSLFERVAVVLADKAIAAHHEQKTWDEIRDLVINGLKSGRGTDGFVQAITRCSAILEEHFPVRADDVDELANHLRIIG